MPPHENLIPTAFRPFPCDPRAAGGAQGDVMTRPRSAGPGSGERRGHPAPWLRRPGVIRIGHQPERDFWRVASATDACINLRYPTAGETSGIAIRFMGIGKPVIVSNGEETSGYPGDACLRVDSGPAEEEMLTQYMLSLRHLTGLGTEIGRRAAEHIRRWHSVERVAELYWETLCAYSQRV